MARAAIYMRVSSVGQEENYSLPDQELNCRSWCEHNSHDATLIFNDGAQKSDTLDRPGLDDMFYAAKRGEFDILVVGKYDRFSRKQTQQQAAIYQLNKYGVSIVSVREPVPEGPVGDFIRSSYAFAAEVELLNIRLRTTTGRKSRIKDGKILASSHPLYGYLWVNPDEKHGKNAYIPDPEIAPHVVLIFDLVASGMTLRKVMAELEARGVPTPYQVALQRGYLPKNRTTTGNWSSGSLKRLLSNPAYIGKHSGWRTVLEEVKVVDKVTGEVRIVKRKKELAWDDPERITFDASVCPALVDESTFAAVQQVLKRNSAESARHLGDREGVLLRNGFATCGYCGKNLTVRWDRRNNNYRYHCGSNGHSETGGCPGGNWSVTGHRLDEIVWGWVLRAFENPEIIRAAFAKWKAEQSEGRTFEYDRLDAVKAALESSTNRWRNCLSSAAEAKDEETRAQFTHMADTAGKEMKKNQAEYDKLAGVLTRADARVEQVDSLIAMGDRAMEHLRTADWQDKRTFLYALGVLIRVKSLEDYKIDWRLEQIQEQWVQAQLCIPANW